MSTSTTFNTLLSTPSTTFNTLLSNQDQAKDDNQELGGRRRKTQRHNPSKPNKNVVIVGKVYADWCGHCQMLKPEWAKMKHHIYSKRGKKHIVFAEIEEKQIDKKLRKLEKDHSVKVNVNGYPTLFRIEGGKVKYYNGNRQSNAMSHWYLRGGDGDQENDSLLPGMLQDQQGGRHTRYHRRPFYTRYRNNRHHRFHGKYKGTRTLKHVEKKEPGMFDFLFGK